MLIQFNVKEDNKVEENSITITINLKSENRSNKFNNKRLDNLTEQEKKCIDEVMSIVEKYSNDEQGGQDVKYAL